MARGQKAREVMSKNEECERGKIEGGPARISVFALGLCITEVRY